MFEGTPWSGTHRERVIRLGCLCFAQSVCSSYFSKSSWGQARISITIRRLCLLTHYHYRGYICQSGWGQGAKLWFSNCGLCLIIGSWNQVLEHLTVYLKKKKKEQNRNYQTILDACRKSLIGWMCLPTPIHTLKSQLPAPQRVTVFRDRVSKGAMRLKWGH